MICDRHIKRINEQQRHAMIVRRRIHFLERFEEEERRFVGFGCLRHAFAEACRCGPDRDRVVRVQDALNRIAADGGSHCNETRES